MTEKKKAASKDAGGQKTSAAKEASADEKQPAPKERPAEKADAPAKKPVERTFVNTHTGVASDRPTPTPGTVSAAADIAASRVARKQNALPFRIAAAALWLVGIALEVVAVLCLNGTIYLPGLSQTTWFIAFLVLDFIAVVIGSQLWKRANHMNPPSRDNALLYWLQTELGVLVAIVAFAPIVVVLLADKKADKRSRTVGLVVAVLALVVAGVSGVDFNPTSQEEYDEAVAAVAELGDGSGDVYWTTYGRVYHLNPDCQAIRNSATIYSGDVADAFAAKRSRPCEFCAEWGGSDVLAKAGDATAPADEGGDEPAGDDAAAADATDADGAVADEEDEGLAQAA